MGHCCWMLHQMHENQKARHKRNVIDITFLTKEEGTTKFFT